MTALDLLAIPTGTITEEGVRLNIDVGIQYLEAWLRGNGAVTIYSLMEDAATAEISRAQVWQWAKHGAKLEDGRLVTPDLVKSMIANEVARHGDNPNGKFKIASDIFGKMMLDADFSEFLILPAYESPD